MSAVARLLAILEAEGGLMASAVGPSPAPARQATACGPRMVGRREDYELALAAVREGYELHYATGRVLAPDDPDLALLAGDRLYALGLERLVELGDGDGVAELAELISLCAVAHTAGDVELAEAAWEAATTAIGWGGDDDLRGAHRAARQARPEAARALRHWASRRRGTP